MNDVQEFTAPVAVPNVPTRAQIDEAERAIAQLHGRIYDLPVTHHFAPGLYARELRIPAGVMLTGKIHRTEHLNVISAGDITVWTEQGMVRIKAPYTFVSKPGTKRIGMTHADTVWTTFHVTNETDPVKIEEEVIEPSDNLVGLEEMKVIP